MVEFNDTGLPDEVVMAMAQAILDAPDCDDGDNYPAHNDPTLFRNEAIWAVRALKEAGYLLIAGGESPVNKEGE